MALKDLIDKHGETKRIHDDYVQALERKCAALTEHCDKSNEIIAHYDKKIMQLEEACALWKRRLAVSEKRCETLQKDNEKSQEKVALSEGLTEFWRHKYEEAEKRCGYYHAALEIDSLMTNALRDDIEKTQGLIENVTGDGAVDNVRELKLHNAEVLKIYGRELIRLLRSLDVEASSDLKRRRLS